MWEHFYQWPIDQGPYSHSSIPTEVSLTYPYLQRLWNIPTTQKQTNAPLSITWLRFHFHHWLCFFLELWFCVKCTVQPVLAATWISRPPLYFGRSRNNFHTISMECCLHSAATCPMHIAARQPHPDGSRLIQFVLPTVVTTVQPLGKFPAGRPTTICGLVSYYLVVQIQACVVNSDVC